jgi:hypothetical protein
LAINPRTGVIGIGGKSPKKKRPAVSVALGNPFPLNPRIPPVVVPEVSAATMVQISELVQKLAIELGSKIDLLMSQKTTIFYPHSKEEVPSTVDIDESIADVGLGEMKELKKGLESGDLTKEEVKKDDQLASTFNKLRALKKKGF